MKVFSTLFTFLIFVFSFHFISCQEEDEESRAAITRETIEAILSIVSPGCKSEIEMAMQSQTDVTNECKYEIQAALQAFHGQQGEQEGQRQPGQQQPPQPKPVPQHAIHPAIIVLGLVVVAFIGIGIYVSYVNKALSETFSSKSPKKLSKQKLEKAKRKGKL